MAFHSDEQSASPPAGVFALALLCAVLQVSGCAQLRSPAPPAAPPEQVVEAVRAWTGSIRTVTDTDISLVIETRAGGETEKTPTLGGHIAFDTALPGLWLRTEKVGREIFSLKALGGQFWLALPDTCEVVTGSAVAYGKLPELIRPDEVRSWFAGPDSLGLTWPSTTMSVEGSCYRFDVHVLGAPYRRVLVDRRKLVIAAIESYDVLGRRVTNVRLDKYATVQGRPFPRRLTVERPLSGVTVRLRLGDPILNKDLPLEAFLPPERPDWRVINLDRQPLSAVEAFRED